MSGGKKLKQYFDDYSNFHQTSGNKMTHYLGIPLIVVSLLGLLSQWVFPWEGISYLRWDAGVLLLIFGSAWYLLLDWKLGLPFTFVLTGFYFLGRALPGYVNWSLFVLGWILQGIGHAVYEKKSPAFFRNLTHIMIGPFWIFARVIFRLNRS